MLPGAMLVRKHVEEATKKAWQLRFAVTSDPIEFVAKVQMPASRGKGNVVLATPVDTDFSLSAMVAVAFMGGFFATPKEFMTKATPPRGIAYPEHYKSAKSNWHLAVSAAVATELPTLPQLLRSIALAPGSCCVFYPSERNLCKFFKAAVRKSPRIPQRMCVLSNPADRAAADKKYQGLYITPRGFLLKFPSEGGVCPGWRPSSTPKAASSAARG